MDEPETVYALRYVPWGRSGPDALMIGYFSSEDAAEQATRRLSTAPGFVDGQGDFALTPIPVGRTEIGGYFDVS